MILVYVVLSAFVNLVEAETTVPITVPTQGVTETPIVTTLAPPITTSSPVPRNRGE